jgi:arginine/lysine/ornithine decarboxylase
MDHHLIPKCYGGKEKVVLDRDCHKAIHALLTNKQLRDEYHTIQALLGYDPLRRMIKFISKQDPTRKVTMKFANDRPRRGKYG